MQIASIFMNLFAIAVVKHILLQTERVFDCLFFPNLLHNYSKEVYDKC